MQEKKSAEVYRSKIHSAFDNNSPHFAWYYIMPIINELRKFGCEIYPITSSSKKLYDRTKQGSLMGYTNSRATVKLWDQNTKKIRYCSYAKFYEQNNKFVKRWSHDSELMNVTNVFTLTKLKNDPSDHPLIKYYIFEVTVTLP